MKKEMNGKVVLITGATSGIGKATAIGLGAKGATLVLVARNKAKGQVAKAEIIKETGNDRVELMIADLASLHQIRILAEYFKARYSRLHVLINNAGAIFGHRSLTVDGYERTFAVNHLAPFLLTNLLLDVLKASAPSRVITVSSQAHEKQALNFNDLQNEKNYSEYRVYGESKLANILFAKELARRLKGTGVTSNALHPGVVATNFGRSGSKALRAMISVAKIFFLSPENGAETSIYLASSPKVKNITGRYFVKKRPYRSSPISYDEEAAWRLWEESEELTGLALAEDGEVEWDYPSTTQEALVGI
jgi:NAD(P)-dependent dehydrogenase (short-subunit alcohol dehydrogenase family)